MPRCGAAAKTCTTEGEAALNSLIVASSYSARPPRGVTVRGSVAAAHSETA